MTAKKYFISAILFFMIGLCFDCAGNGGKDISSTSHLGIDDDHGDDSAEGPPEYLYDVPVKDTSPWPMFRRTSRNNGQSPIVPQSSGKRPWSFQTQKGIFHAPVIDEDGTVYIGSADTNFYAINPNGTEKWRLETGEIIDSSALIAADGTIYFPSGDGFLYALNPNGGEKWRLQAQGLEGFITWWEGHITMGPDGTLYAGNDDRHMYAIDPSGTIKWTVSAFDQVWSCPAFGNHGDLFYGANDFFIRSVTPEGSLRWMALTLGPVASSPAMNDMRDTLFVGSFDGYVHALDSQTGWSRWKFAARDHIYSSPAIGPDGTIYIGSADGTMYAVNQEGGLKWAFDTLDPIRSSAAVDGDGNIYFGCADGKLYALHSNGKKWWSFDTTTGDRNDLNGSPAITPDGIVIGGEAGAIHFVPFDYCETNIDSRCDLSPEESIPANGALIYYYTPGGSSFTSIVNPIMPREVVTFRLVVREKGDTTRARINSSDLHVAISPNVKHRVEVSADGNFVCIIPEKSLDMDSKYTMILEGKYLVNGLRIGNKVTGGDQGGGFEGSFDLKTVSATGNPFPLEIGNDQVSVIRMKRMAAPQPTMLATFNQIGFDSYNYLLASVLIDAENNKFILLAVEGTPGMNPSVNPNTKSIFPLNGTFEDSYFNLAGQGFNLDVTGVSIKLDLFQVSGLLHPDLTSNPLNIYAEVKCSNIEFFGFALDLLGLCNPESNKMIVNGTAFFEAHTGAEGAKIEGLAVDSLIFEHSGGMYGGGYIEAVFSPNQLVADAQLPVILMVDPDKEEALELNYGTSLEKIADASENLHSVKLYLPVDFDPSGKKAIVIVNLYPMYEQIM